MKVWRLRIGSTPTNTFQRKIRPEPIKEGCGLESLWLRGIDVEVKDCLQITNYDRQILPNRRRHKHTAG